MAVAGANTDGVAGRYTAVNAAGAGIGIVHAPIACSVNTGYE
jgi:hypothetical protein